MLVLQSVRAEALAKLGPPCAVPAVILVGSLLVVLRVRLRLLAGHHTAQHVWLVLSLL